MNLRFDFLYILQHLVHSDRSLSTEYLWSSSRTQTRPKAIAPHWSSSYPEYLSPIQGQEEQRRVVWDRLHSHRASLAKRLSTTKERYLTARRELNPKTTQAESSHDPLYRDTCQGSLSFRNFVVLIILLDISLWKYHD